MNRSHVRYVLVIAVAMLVLSACDKSSANTSGDDNNANNTNNNTNNNNDKPIIVDGEGPDEDAEDIKPGPAQGNWRVATDDAEDRPIVVLAILQDEGKPELLGSFTTMPASFEEDSNGDIAGTFASDTITVTFNPTAQQEELYTLSATKQGADPVFKGTLNTATGDSTKVVVTLVPGD